MPTLPQTETLRQALEHLHAYTDASPSEVVASVLDNSVEPSLSVVHQTVRFVIAQLCFFAPQDGQAVEELLDADVSTSYGTPQRLSKEWRLALTEAWLSTGKSLVQAAREKAVERHCNPQGHAPRFLAVEAEVVTSSGRVTETLPEEAGVPSVDYQCEVNRHVPAATVLFPPTSCYANRTPVMLDAESLYKLFVELDNVQKSVDTVKGTAP